MTEVATDESFEIWTSSGSNTISEKGRTNSDGNPFCIVLIWTVTGISVSSTDLKNKSHLVRKIPEFSSILNDCAKGSLKQNPAPVPPRTPSSGVPPGAYPGESE